MSGPVSGTLVGMLVCMQLFIAAGTTDKAEETQFLPPPTTPHWHGAARGQTAGLDDHFAESVRRWQSNPRCRSFLGCLCSGALRSDEHIEIVSMGVVGAQK